MKKYINITLATLMAGTAFFSTSNLVSAASTGHDRITVAIGAAEAGTAGTTGAGTAGTTGADTAGTTGAGAAGTAGTTGAGTTGTAANTNNAAGNANNNVHGIDRYHEDITAFVKDNIISQSTADRMRTYLPNKHQAENINNQNDKSVMIGSVRFEQNADGSVICNVEKRDGSSLYFEQKPDGSAAYYEKTAVKESSIDLSDMYSDMVKEGILTEGELVAITNYQIFNRKQLNYK